MKNFVFLSVAVLCLCACSQTKYVAHVAKQIPLGVDKPMNTIGHFKVGNPYTIKGRQYFPQESYNLVETGIASWYGPGFHGKLTANGEVFDQNELTAAHRTLQIPSIVRVTNLENGRSVVMRVNDRGPFAHNRILDVSERGAVVLGFKRQGTAQIRLEVLGPQSREVANMARVGKSTRGYEVTYNQQQRQAIAPTTPLNVASIAPPPVRATATLPAQVVPTPVVTQPVYQSRNNQPITRVGINETVNTQSPIDNPVMNGAMLQAVAPAAGYAAQNAGKLFVQAGAFSSQQNANSYQQQLASLGPTEMFQVQVNNQPFYRVRLGPFADQNYAQHVLSMLQQSGNQTAKLITE